MEVLTMRLLLSLLPTPARWTKYYDQRVCVSVCLTLAYLIQIGPNFTKLSVRVNCDCGVVLLQRQCNVLPVLCMTSCVHTTAPMGQTRRYVLSSSPDGGTWGEVYRFRLHLVYALIIGRITETHVGVAITTIVTVNVGGETNIL